MLRRESVYISCIPQSHTGCAQDEDKEQGEHVHARIVMSPGAFGAARRSLWLILLSPA